jgi:hypothetical protein
MILLQATEVADPTFWLHWGVTTAVVALVSILWYQYTKGQDARDKQLEKLEAAIEYGKEKLNTVTLETRNEFYTELNKVKDSYIHDMKDVLMKELTEIKVTVANINRNNPRS